MIFPKLLKKSGSTFPNKKSFTKEKQTNTHNNNAPLFLQNEENKKKHHSETTSSLSFHNFLKETNEWEDSPVYPSVPPPAFPWRRKEKP